MPNPYERFVLPKLIDTACSQPAMSTLRAQYVSQAEGDVLEVGIGSGLNLQHYGTNVRHVVGVDPSESLTDIAQERAERAEIDVEVVGVSGEALPLDNHQFDCVVCTWTLCTIPNPYRAVEELRRVLKPQGRLIFVEHGRSSEPHIARWQRRIEPFWKIIAGGCHLTRQADELLVGGGFRIQQKEKGYVEGPKVAAFMTRGVALPA